jgi:hypothetical protein
VANEEGEGEGCIAVLVIDVDMFLLLYSKATARLSGNRRSMAPFSEYSVVLGRSCVQGS